MGHDVLSKCDIFLEIGLTSIYKSGENYYCIPPNIDKDYPLASVIVQA